MNLLLARVNLGADQNVRFLLRLPLVGKVDRNAVSALLESLFFAVNCYYALLTAVTAINCY